MSWWRSAYVLILFALAVQAQWIPGRYIVELTDQPVAEHIAIGALDAPLRRSPDLQSGDAVRQRERVQAAQGEVRSRIERRNARVLDSVSTVANALFVSIPDADAANLASIPGVKRVYPVREFKLVLDRAVAIHKVNEVWNQIGGDKAGEGIKVGIIDTGIETKHPAFQGAALSVPATYPRMNAETDAEFTNNKVIVARSYVSLLRNEDPDQSARDHVGHGTALGMIVAGARVTGPYGPIAGIAPRAFLGSYKIFGTPGVNSGATEDAILKAIDDAVADGMDVINLSFGTDFAPRLADDPSVAAVERAAKAGVIVIAASGNEGPLLNSLSSPSTAPSAIAVGSTTNDRLFGVAAEVAGQQYIAVLPNPVAQTSPVSGPLADVSALDTDGLACATLPASSLTGKVALILRGSCTFESKLNNAQRSGAIGAIVYATAEAPDPFIMGVGLATLPAEMVSNADGVAMKAALGGESPPPATLRFEVGPVATKPNLRSDFSSAGPGVDLAIKPDLVAVGSDFYTATQTVDPNGQMYSGDGFIVVDGTSFSSPVVAGVAALIKSARPGLTVDQYRSLIVNSSTASPVTPGEPPSVQRTGAGSLNAMSALNTTLAAAPVSLSFGSGGSTIDASRTLTLSNVGGAGESYFVEVSTMTGTSSPVFSGNTIAVDKGGKTELSLTWKATELARGPHEGFVTLVGATSGTRVRVPYWYAVTSTTADKFRVLSATTTGRRGALVRDALLFRIIDSAGVAIVDPLPTVTVVSGDGSAREIVSYDGEIPGLLGLTVQLGPLPGANVFRIKLGEASYDVTVTGR